MHLEQTSTISTQPLLPWYQEYFSAVLETDEGKALLRIVRAAGAIECRLIQLRSSPVGNSQELIDLDSALTYL